MQKEIKLDNGKIVVVAKLPIKKYADLLKAVRELPKHLNGLEGLANDQILAKLPEILAESLPDVVRLINVATDLPENEIEELGVSEITDIFVAIIEVNRYAEVYEKVKKALTRPVVPVKK